MSTTSKETLRKTYTENTIRLVKIINPLPSATYECDCDFNYVEKMLARYEEDYGGLELNPDFQRGHVWTEDQQKHYIENILKGVVTTSGFLIQFNCPNWNDENYIGDLPKGFQCIDGLQRITAVRSFMKGETKPFGLSLKDLEISRFSTKGSAYRLRVAIFDFKYKKELIKHYLDLNTGGTPHSEQEITRVKQMLNNL